MKQRKKNALEREMKRKTKRKKDINMIEIAPFNNNLCCELYRKISRFPFNMNH